MTASGCPKIFFQLATFFFSLHKGETLKRNESSIQKHTFFGVLYLHPNNQLVHGDYTYFPLDFLINKALKLPIIITKYYKISTKESWGASISRKKLLFYFSTYFVKSSPFNNSLDFFFFSFFTKLQPNSCHLLFLIARSYHYVLFPLVFPLLLFTFCAPLFNSLYVQLLYSCHLYFSSGRMSKRRVKTSRAVF